MIKKLFNLSIVSALCVALLLFSFAKINALTESECAALLARIESYEEDLKTYQCSDPSSPNQAQCQIIRNNINSLRSQYGEGCGGTETPCTPRFQFDRFNDYYKVDGGEGYIVWRINYGGEVLFCVEPDALMRNCTENYTTTAASMSQDQFMKLSTAAALYNEQPSETHYVGVQMYFWQVMGRSRTVNGQGINAYWSGLSALVDGILAGTIDSGDYGIESVVHVEEHIVDFRDGSYSLDLGDSYSSNSSFTNPDNNSELGTGNFDISGTYGTNASRSGNSAVGYLSRIYPLNKTVSATPNKAMLMYGKEASNRKQ